MDIGGIKVSPGAPGLFRIICGGGWFFVACNMLTLNGSKLSPVRIGFLNVYDVLDGFMLRCTGSGTGSLSLFVRNMLSLDGSKMFPACICLF